MFYIISNLGVVEEYVLKLLIIDLVVYFKVKGCKLWYGLHLRHRAALA